MTTRTGNISSLLAPGLRKVFFDVYKGLGEAQYAQVCNIVNTDRNYFDDYEMSMLGGDFPVKDEGVGIGYVDPVSGNTKRYTPITYGKGFRITEEAYEDDLYKTIGPKASKALAKAARNAMEVKFGLFLDDAITGTTYTGFDGHHLLHVATAGHTILYTGALYGNAPATAVDLSVTSLQAGITNMRKQPDSDGVIAGIVPKKLVIPPDLEFVARELLESAYKPFTANNEINTLKGFGISIVLNYYQTDTDQWMLLGDQHDINWVWRRKLKFDNSDDFDSGDAKFKGTYRAVIGFGDWRGTYGCAGG